MAQGVVYQDSTGAIIAANPAAEKILGLTLDQLQGRTSIDPRWKAIHQDGTEFPGTEHPAMVALQTGKPVVGEVMGVFHPDKEDYVWIQIHAEPEFRQGEPIPYRVFAVFTDITETINGKKALIREEDMNELLLSISTQYINLPFDKIDGSINYSLGELGRFMEADRAYIIEYDWEQMVCNNSYEWCADGIEPFIEHLQEVPVSEIPEWVETHQKGETMYVRDVAALPKDSHLRNLLEPQSIQSLIAVPIMDDDECVAFVGFDAVRNKHNYTGSEEKILQLFAQTMANLRKRIAASEALRHNETRYRRLTENMSDFIWTSNQMRQLDYISPSCSRIFGYRPEELQEGILDKLFPATSQEQVVQALDTLIQMAEQGQLSETDTFTLDVLAHNKEKEQFWLSTNYKGRFNASNEFTGIIGVSRDITNRKEAEIALQQSLNNLSERVREQQCMYNIAHLFGVPDLDLHDYLQRVVDLLPMGFQQPDKTWVRLTSGGDVYKTSPFRETKQCLTMDFTVQGDTSGIEVFQPDDMGFLEEKRFLLLAIKESILQFAQLHEADAEMRKFKSIADQASYGAILTTLEGNMIYVNESFARLHGYAKEELIGKHIKLFHNPAKIARMQELLHQLQTKGSFSFQEVEHLRKDGSSFPAILSAETVLDKEGNGAFFSVTLMDITEKKKQDAEMDVQNKKLNAIFDAMPDMIFVTDEDGNYLEFYHSPDNLDAIQYNELLGKNVRDAFDSMTADRILACIKECIRTKKVTQLEYARLENGVLKHFEGRFIYFGGNRVLRFVRNISDRVKDQAEITRLSMAIEQSPIAIVITDLEGVIQYASPAFTHITGYNDDEVIGHHTRMLKSGKTPTEVYADMWQTIQTGKEWQGEWQNKKKNGELYWESITITPIFMNGDTHSAYMAVKQDTTQTKNYLLAIEQQNAALKEIAWTQSHVVRAPLSRMMGLIGILSLPESPSFPREKIIGAILDSANEIDDIVRDITSKAYVAEAIESVIKGHS